MQRGLTLPVPVSGKKICARVVYLDGPICEMHDDRLRCPDPPPDLRYGGQPRPGCRWRPSGGRPAPRHRLPPLGEVLVHVLGKVAEEGELLLEGGRDLVGGHAAAATTLTKLNVTETETRMSKEENCSNPAA